jgi:hypothetical protein
LAGAVLNPAQMANRYIGVFVVAPVFVDAGNSNAHGSLTCLLFQVVDGVTNVRSTATEVDDRVPMPTFRHCQKCRQASEKAAQMSEGLASPVEAVIVVIHHENIALVIAVHSNLIASVEPIPGVNVLHHSLRQ